MERRAAIRPARGVMNEGSQDMVLSLIQPIRFAAQKRSQSSREAEEQRRK